MLSVHRKMHNSRNVREISKTGEIPIQVQVSAKFHLKVALNTSRVHVDTYSMLMLFDDPWDLKPRGIDTVLSRKSEIEEKKIEGHALHIPH